MRNVALAANLAWISFILARFAMKGGQVHDPKLMTRGRSGRAEPRRGSLSPVRGEWREGFGAEQYRPAVLLMSCKHQRRIRNFLNTFLIWDPNVPTCRLVLKKSSIIFQV